MMRRLSAVLILAGGLMPYAMVAAADGDVVPDMVEISLTNGDRARGSLVDETPEAYVLHQTVVTRSGSIATDQTYEKSRVTDLIHIQKEYDQRAATVADTAAGHAALAQWCLDEQLITAADAQAHQALAKDAAEARAVSVLVALGYVDDHGTWMKTADYLAAHDLAIYDGIVMGQDQKANLVDLTRQREADRLEQDRKQRAADAIANAIALDQATIADDTRTAAACDQRISTDQGVIAAVDTAKKALDAAENPPKKKNSKKPITTKDAVKQAQQTYTDAVAAGQNAQNDLADATSRKTAATTDQKRAQTDLDAEQAKQGPAQSDAQAATATAERSAKIVADALNAIVPPSDLPPQLVKKAAAP
jgi:hypothetical protein